MEPGLRNSGENEGVLAHQMLLVQLSISAVNFSVILKEIEHTTLICDYFYLLKIFLSWRPGRVAANSIKRILLPVSLYEWKITDNCTSKNILRTFEDEIRLKIFRAFSLGPKIRTVLTKKRVCGSIIMEDQTTLHLTA